MKTADKRVILIIKEKAAQWRYPMIKRISLRNRLMFLAVLDQKLTVGIPFPRGLQQVFFLLSTWFGLPKSPELHLQPQANYPKFGIPPEVLLLVMMTNHPII